MARIRAAIGLGSNVGNRARHIAEAIGELTENGEVAAVSALYESAPVGGPRQGPYLNAVVVLDTSLSPRGLLESCLEIERRHGRERTERWGPRTLDLDILLYGSTPVNETGLEIPHPRLLERRFVLDPLLEAWPEAELPDGTLLSSSVAAVAEQKVVRLRAPMPTRRLSVAVFLATGVVAALLWWVAGRFL